MRSSASMESVCVLITDGKHGDCENEADSGYYFLSCKDVRDGKLHYTDSRQITEADFVDTHRRTRLEPGDILITNSGTIGRMAIADDSDLTRRTTFQKSVAIVKPDRRILDSRWFYYYLLADAERLINFAGGTAQKNLLLRDMRAFRVSYPGLEEQHRIASILSAYDDLIQNNTRRIAILEEMARRIYEEWFVRFRFPGHEEVRMVESDLGAVPKGWDVKSLANVAEITMGLSPKGDTYNENGDGTPLVNGPVEFGERFTKKIKWTTAPTKLSEAGDLIVCVRGSTTGKYVKSDDVYCLGRGVCSIRSEYQCFVDQLFIHHLPALLAQTGGSTFPSWTGPQLKGHAILAPPANLLMRFESLVEPMSKAVFAYSRQNSNLRLTRDLLLPKLISGELDVCSFPEPEAAVA